MSGKKGKSYVQIIFFCANFIGGLVDVWTATGGETKREFPLMVFISTVLIMAGNVIYVCGELYLVKKRGDKAIRWLHRRKKTIDLDQFDNYEQYVLKKEDIRDQIDEKKQEIKDEAQKCHKELTKIVGAYGIVLMLLLGLSFHNTGMFPWQIYTDNGSVTIAENAGENADNVSEGQVELGSNSSDVMVGDGAEEIKTIDAEKTFYLDEPDRERIPAPEILDEVFYLCDTEGNPKEKVDEHMSRIMNEQREDTFTTEATALEKEQIDAVSELQKSFDSSVGEAEKCIAEGDYEGWQAALVHSQMLDEIIETRYTLYCEGKCNSEIAFMLANNYQAYALGYQKQNGSGMTILCYYLDSIVWAEQALAYEGLTKERKALICVYIRARYEDIATCELIDEVYRKKAETIYNCMREEDKCQGLT